MKAINTLKSQNMKTQLKFICLLVSALYLGCESDDGSTITLPPQYNLNALQGNWFRVGGNNPNNNGMLVNVNDDAGTIILPQNSGFSEGDLKWKAIVPQNETNYTYQELGSSYNYFDASMSLGSDDTLRISVGASGAGNIQKWVRQLAENHDCMPYNAEGSNVAVGDEWELPNETDTYPSFVPATGQPGGGIYTVTLSNGSGVVPALKVKSSNDNSGAISSGTAAGTDNETVRTTSFIAHPGVSYDVDAQYSSFVISDNPPITYNLSWSFSGRMDCYEPNDVVSEAKRIPKNQTIEAFALTGYVNNSVIVNEAQNNDYYSVQLESSAKLKVDLLQVPTSVNLNVKILRLDESAIGVTYEEVSGEITADGAIYNTLTDSVLPSGIYLIRIYIGGERTTVINDGESAPDHWGTPYTFKVSAVN